MQKLIKAQADGDCDSGETQEEQLEEEVTRDEEPIPKRQPMSPEEKIQHVRDTTVRELEKLIPEGVRRFVLTEISFNWDSWFISSKMEFLSTFF